MPELLHCPSCNAGLEYPEGSESTIRCSYCGSTVVVPEKLRQPKTQPQSDMTFTSLQVEINPSQTVSPFVVVAILVVVFLAIAGVAGMIWYEENQRITSVRATTTANAARVATQVAQAEAQASTSVVVIPTLTPEPTPAFANLVLQFGEKGSGRGQFEEARWLTVDNSGHIYVLDGANNRLQIFNEAGEYQTHNGY